MKKILLLCLLSLSFSQEFDYSKMSDAEKIMMYQMYKKSPTLGTVFTLVLPTSGHAYAGNWNRGLKLFGGRLLSVGISFGLSNYFWEEDLFTKEVRMDLDRILGVSGVISFIYFTVKEWTDVSNEVHLYNKRLKRQIFGKEQSPNLGFNLYPLQDGAGISLTYLIN